MNEEQRMVHDFHERFGLLHQVSPAWPGEVVHRLRVCLIEEELAELRNAGEAHDLVGVADALADLLYVVYGAAVTYGIDLEPVFKEIHRSNMSKGDPEVVTRPDGKILKGVNYRPPDVAGVMENQLTAVEPQRIPVPAG
jgi:predicted HAD superfamily Cof-like phosphohydrolase